MLTALSPQLHAPSRAPFAEQKLFLFFFFFFKIFIYLFLDSGEGRERNINVWLPLERPLRGTWPTTQARVLTRN